MAQAIILVFTHKQVKTIHSHRVSLQKNYYMQHMFPAK